MASTYTESTGTQLLDHPVETEPARPRLPRQARVGAPLLGVTAMTAALGATGLTAAPAQAAAPAPAPVAAADEASEGLLAADPGLALAARILQQADGQRTVTEESARVAAAQEAEARHADRRAETAAATDPAATEAGSETGAGTGAVLPVAGHRLTDPSARSGAHWAHLRTGLDFAARTGTPVTAVTAGTVTSAGWSGTYGYRVIQTLPDGTELWYCHLSRIAAPVGRVAPGTVLGAVGATGNATAPHLHLEVRPGGAAPVDPLPWLHHLGLRP
ncbi:murein DD-endopeptidase MepM/ murein hydrolase activator NlpD [Kitasatospora sp. SolWspMP-SS2h]|uniref:M23 family metallopeptidase n=1 Tax=Kitasatospora sp. SolWspMP-SS2h TaxID=1305729 RepID=UPI000DC012B4|nr:M23 family metallopeptidase [Kitasatospora sp. SolWspMP-SS2h]RAJ38516.1 murein DD-endopeptidase MepM/ murein hydrolase activator NlpD [Kitasatospora sp. SolWspMP-SS2h]